MIVWGGTDSTSNFNNGGRYNPSTDTWTATSTSNAPAGREQHTAVWTGTEMIVWGGAYDDGEGTRHPPGGRYNPSTDTWTAIATSAAPAARASHTAVWTGTEMIVWGGIYYDGSLHFLDTGGRYNPSTDNWMATSTTNAPEGCSSQTAVWTGTEMIVWGGYNGSNSLNSGGRYNPSTDSWAATTTSTVPAARVGHSAVWTSTEMIVWGRERLFNRQQRRPLQPLDE